MANMFKCALAGGGDGASLIVTCTQNFAGSTITLTNGTKTYTQVCPLTSPYEVIFKSIATGVWTVSGIAQGQTFSISVTITDFEALLADIPEGSTVTPTDDIQIWLHCANIWDKTYTTISQILSDASTLQALIASNNAADYMARSTTWASDVTADSSAMTYIGLDDYCADSLLGNSIWLDTICNSTYFESVLNVKVPTMTSNTTPSGVAAASSEYGGHPAFHAFDKSLLTFWSTQGTAVATISYKFSQPVKCVYAIMTNRNQSSSSPKNFKIETSNDNATWAILGTYTNNNNAASANTYYIFPNSDKNDYYRLNITSKNGSGSNMDIGELQFYGRA